MAKRLAQLKIDAKNDGWGRYIQTASDEAALLEGCYVDKSRGERVCHFFRTWLRHSKGEWVGQPFELAPVQRDEIIMPLFSWLRPNGTRRFRTAGIWVPKKNFKSTMAAGLACYGLLGDGEGGAEIYCGANDKKQAGIVYGAAADMVEKSPALLKMCKTIRSQKRIVVRNNQASWLEALSADIATKEGLNAHWVIIDELHVFDERGRRFFDTLRYSGAARAQPLTIIISTAGEDESGIGFEEYSAAKEILNGAVDTTAFVFIREAERSDDPGDPKVWHKANPMIGVTIKEDEMARTWNTAKRTPRLIEQFRRYRLNIWIATSQPWLDVHKWDLCDGVVDNDELVGRPCFGGLDLAQTQDMSSLCLCFPMANERYVFKWWFWLPGSDILDRERRDRSRYREWEQAGWMTLTDGDTADNSLIEDEVVELSKLYEIREIAFDRYGAKDLTQRLQDNHEIVVYPFAQGPPSFNLATGRFEKLILDRDMVHGGNPVMRQQVQRVSLRIDSNKNIMPMKADKKRSNKVDGVVAACMALDRALMATDKKSVYESRGVLVLG